MMNPVKSSYEIRNLKEFLKKSLESPIVDYNLKSLTKPGDNYGSVMQSLVVKILDENDHEKWIHLVCKSGVTNPYLVEIFQPELTFVKETQFYMKIIPTIEQFEEDLSIPRAYKLDAFVKCIGSRISLNPEAELADADALLALENIKAQNYINEDRRIGFDTETTNAILKQLAQFHAICIAMRLLQPELFKTNVYLYLKAVNLSPKLDDTRLVDNVCNELGYLENLDPQLRQIIEKQLYICDRLSRDTKRLADTPYTTVTHHDLWVNNIMILRDEVGKPAKVKIYDFQLYFYHSFVCDLIFFLCTSVQTDDLMENFHLFIHRYCEHFTNTLKLANCSTDDYTSDKMWHEMKENAKVELLHILFMLKICNADEKKTPSMDEISDETFLKSEKPSDAILNRWKCIIDLFKQNEFI